MAALEIPSLMGFRSKKFIPVHNQQVNPTGSGGYTQVFQRSIPTWYAEYTTPPLNGPRYNETISFLDSLEGGLNTFLGYDPRRPMPYAYRDMDLLATPWGSPNFTGYNVANSTLTLNNFAAGSVITKGDYLAFFDGKGWHLFRSMQTVTASGTQVLTVKPRPHTAIQPGTHAIRYVKAPAEMKMIGNYEEDDSVDTFPTIRFKAWQFIGK